MKRFWEACRNLFIRPTRENNEVARVRSGSGRRRVRNRSNVPAETDNASPGIRNPAPTRLAAPPAASAQPPPVSPPNNTNNERIRPRRPAPPPPPQYPLPPTAPPSDSLCRDMGLPADVSKDLPRRQDPEYEMFQQLSCPICLDLFTDPVLLPCLHSLCRACGDTIRAHSNPFACPVCKQPVGLESPKRNFPLNNMVDIFKRDAETRKRVAIPAATLATPAETPVVSSNRCSSEDVPGQTAAIFSVTKCAACATTPSTLCCVQCKMAFCDTCLIDYHPTVETTPDHTLIPVSKVKNHPDNAPRLNVQGSLCNVMGSMMRVHAEMLQTLRRMPSN